MRGRRETRGITAWASLPQTPISGLGLSEPGLPGNPCFLSTCSPGLAQGLSGRDTRERHQAGISPFCPFPFLEFLNLSSLPLLRTLLKENSPPRNWMPESEQLDEGTWVFFKFEVTIESPSWRFPQIAVSFLSINYSGSTTLITPEHQNLIRKVILPLPTEMSKQHSSKGSQNS